MNRPSLVAAYLGACLLASLIPAGIAACSTQAGASGAVTGGAARPAVTVSIAPARTERVGDGGGDRTHTHPVERMPRRSGSEASTASPSSVPASIAHDYTGVERVVPSELWSAVVTYFPPEQRMKAIQVAHCESRYKADAVVALGKRGVFQVHPVHGAVPAAVTDQVKQAARIQSVTGWRAWSCG